MISDLCLFTVREASNGFIISLRASNRYKEKYLEALERSLAFLAAYAEEHEWPEVGSLTTSHIEGYLVDLAQRKKWFGDRGAFGVVSQSYVETQYRRIKRFFNWMIQRGHVDKNPLDLIPHPKVDERVIPTIPDQEIDALLQLVNPKLFKTPGRHFRAIRDRAVLMLWIDTPGRRAELGELSTDDLDIDGGRLLVMGKGGRERWMHLGHVATETLWLYLQARSKRAQRTNALWVDVQGKSMNSDWLYRMLKRLGKRAGVPGLFPHRFRHTFAVKWIEADQAERVLEIEGGWKRIPATYFATLGEKHAAAAHQRMSPADRLGLRNGDQPMRGERRGKIRGRL